MHALSKTAILAVYENCLAIGFLYTRWSVDEFTHLNYMRWECVLHAKLWRNGRALSV